jgi:integrase
MPLELYRRGEIWHYRGTVAGRRLRGTTGSSRKEIAERVAGLKEQEEWQRHINGTGAVLNFAQAAMLYRQSGKPERFLRKVEDHWQDTPVKTMTAGAIRASAMQIYPNAGPATRNRQAIVVAQAIINHAADLGLCDHIRVKRFPVTRREKAPATWEWVRAFMAHCTKPNLAGLAALMFLTGARISQALAVTWDDVDFQARKVLIRGTGKRDPDRRAHMPPELIAALATIGGERTGAVFKISSRSNCRTQWAGAIRRAGIKPLSYHACRHGFASVLLNNGVSPVTVAKRGGWKSPQHVFATYGHDIAEDDVTDLLTAGTNQTQRNGKLNVAS